MDNARSSLKVTRKRATIDSGNDGKTEVSRLYASVFHDEKSGLQFFPSLPHCHMLEREGFRTSLSLLAPQGGGEGFA